MRDSRERILTSHAGSLPRPDELIEANRARETGGAQDEAAFQAQLRAAVRDVVQRQKEVGVDVPGDGELGKAMGHRVNYRAWWSYSFNRLGGLELGTTGLYDMPARRSRPGEVVLTSFADRRDRLKFAAAYSDPDSGVSTGPRATLWPVCVGPVTYTGHDAIQRDIANLKAALAAAGVEEGFMTSIAPASASRIENRHYRTDEEFLFACADAMREEYKAIVDAGFILQIDDPRLVTYYMMHPELTVEDCRKWAEKRVEAINYSLRGIAPEKVRFHTCYSIDVGPRIHEMALKDIVDIILKINAAAYSFEAANPRHEHEYHVFERVKLPAGKILIPGVISHTTNLVEHPELVAERISRFAKLVGRENVIAGADCGFAASALRFNDTHPSVAWLKFAALAEGARLATKQLWH